MIAKLCEAAVNDERTTIDPSCLTRVEAVWWAMFLLREQPTLPYRKIADPASISEGTVRSRLNRARLELRLELTKLCWK